MSNSSSKSWVYLGPKRPSSYKQLFVKGRNIAAFTLYALSVDREDERGYTIEEIADQYDLSVEAVREAIEYCQSNPPEIQEDWEMDEAVAREKGRNVAPGNSPSSSR